MELRQLQYLARIARVGGFRRAADELDMSQATLSEQIKLLEQEVGVRLFERGSRMLTLTEPGRVLLERAERVLEEVKTAQQEMLEFAQVLIPGRVPKVSDWATSTLGAWVGVGVTLSVLWVWERLRRQRRKSPSFLPGEKFSPRKTACFHGFVSIRIVGL